jgi:glycosyltransferase involved in cell wall biosynthesis
VSPLVEVVVPVHNEQAGLAASVHRLHTWLADQLPYPYRITIADNGSTDATGRLADRLAHQLPGVSVLHLVQKGRGRALKAAWSGSCAPVLAYMDVDLSTDLGCLPPLLAPLVAGEADLAIGTRLAEDALVIRGPLRELLSRGYNQLLRAALGATFSDAQCGFKALRKEVAVWLLPRVRDHGWFFDTELLVLAERAGLRIREVPVVWIDDPDSRVNLVTTAAADLYGIARLAVRR